ncbi:hypothetical protein CIPAW_16G001900 [Carya illinoinensis]|uniref:Uncharacterized protein n=1 Tax=Carya illinoinensis TaxID=32201 RepID=A0A8T1N503_CARIL|nr:hypothetical protein CIPAW_16G001900 [Carya illinoinensis]
MEKNISFLTHFSCNSLGTDETTPAAAERLSLLHGFLSACCGNEEIDSSGSGFCHLAFPS